MIYLIAAIILIIIIFIIVIVIIVNSGKQKYNFRSEVHFSDGANIETGQISSDKNYFKGLSHNQRDTILLTDDFSKRKTILLTDLNSKAVYKFYISNRMALGRNKDVDVVQIENDNTISRKHCELFIFKDQIYIRDLNSSNHTYLNGNVILHSTVCKSEDIIKIGHTKLKIQY